MKVLTSLVGRAQDDRKSLNGIPGTFQRLVKDKGPLEAVRCIVALLFDHDAQ